MPRPFSNEMTPEAADAVLNYIEALEIEIGYARAESIQESVARGLPELSKGLRILTDMAEG